MVALFRDLWFNEPIDKPSGLSQREAEMSKRKPTRRIYGVMQIARRHPAMFRRLTQGVA
jgi:hypothetical protein